ncbi:MAG: type II toxin-antitoxin system HicB family antitoxin [Phycisphaeraceae bacterium]|nr:type II toxin-antitoxin system HicB family antitoxin [Phycisphaeraceae bacterium]
MASDVYRLRLVLAPQPEGGFTVTSPDLPELITEGDSVEEALDNVRDALAAVRELYEDLGRAFPRGVSVSPADGPLEFETLIGAA